MKTKNRIYIRWYSFASGSILALEIVVVFILAINPTFGAEKEKGRPLPLGVKDNPPLLNAAMQNNVDEVQQFLQEGVGINTTNKHGQTALMWAATYGASNAVDVLIKKGGNINQRDGIHQATALMYAARSGHADVVRQLMAAGADAKLFDVNKQTPLIHAAVGNRLDVLNLLVSQKVDLNAQDSMGMTALMWSSMLQCREAVKILVAAGADTALKAQSGMRAVDFANSDILKAELRGERTQ